MEFATKIGIFHIVCEFQTCRIIDIELRSTSPGKCQRGLEKFFENHQVYSNALNPIEKEERILNCKSCEVFFLNGIKDFLLTTFYEHKGN